MNTFDDYVDLGSIATVGDLRRVLAELPIPDDTEVVIGLEREHAPDSWGAIGSGITLGGLTGSWRTIDESGVELGVPPQVELTAQIDSSVVTLGEVSIVDLGLALGRAERPKRESTVTPLVC